MMREIALTPQSLDPSEHADPEEWEDWAREFLYHMISAEGASRFLIANLYNGSWGSLLPDVEAIRTLPQRLQRRMNDLFTAVRNESVTRPARLPEWPQSEDDWLAEALASSKQLELARIISTSKVPAPREAPNGLVRTDDKHRDRGFWDGVCGTGCVALRLADQMEVLRPIVMHASWIALASPYALAASECAFTEELVRCAVRRPEGFNPLRVLDIHISSDDGGLPAESSKSYWKRKFSQLTSGSCIIRAYFWPKGKLLDRIFLAGEIASGDTEMKSPSQRWGLLLSHIARADDPTDQGTEWKLLSKSSRYEWRKRLYDLPGSDPVEKWML